MATMKALMIILIIAVNTHMAVSGRVKPPPAPPRPPTAPRGPAGPVQGISDTFDFIKFCALYMHATSGFIKPNEKCCASAKKVNISQFCKGFFIPATEKVFSPKKVAQVAKVCNNPIPVGTKCGTYVVKNNPMILEQLSE